MKAWEKLEGSEWCQKWFALDEFGLTTDPEGEDAVAFCGIGAVRAVYGIEHDGLEVALQDFTYKLFKKRFVDWQDEVGRCKEEVVDLLRRVEESMDQEELEKVRARVEELKLRMATQPDFGKRVKSGTARMSSEEKAEFKRWMREQSKDTE